MTDMAKEKILIVEDEEDIQELIRYNLEKEGYNNLKVVGSGEKAIEALKSFSPDIISSLLSDESESMLLMRARFASSNALSNCFLSN